MANCFKVFKKRIKTKNILIKKGFCKLSTKHLTSWAKLKVLQRVDFCAWKVGAKLAQSTQHWVLG
jgi:hypothetical protein